MACYLTIAVAARLSGLRGVSAFAEYAQNLRRETKLRIGAFHSPTKNCLTLPTEASFRFFFSRLPPDTLESALRQWAEATGTAAEPIAIDGRDLKGARKQNKSDELMTVAAFEHDSGRVIGQTQVPEKANGIAAARELVLSLDIHGRTVTLDAGHSYTATAEIIVADCGADYVMTAIKENQPTMLAQLQAMPWDDSLSVHETHDKGHGRLEWRRCTVIDVTTPDHAHPIAMYGRAQVARIERQRQTVKSGKVSHEVTYCVTSLTAAQADAANILELVRSHWKIENRLHYVRDFTYDEDRCRAHAGYTARNLSCLSNIAIALIRMQGRFAYIPEANRYYSGQREAAIDLIRTPSALFSR